LNVKNNSQNNGEKFKNNKQFIIMMTKKLRIISMTNL